MLHGNLPPRRGNYCVRDLTVDPRNADILVIATGCQWDRTEGLYRSGDGGQTWQAVSSGLFFDGNGDGRSAGSILVRDPSQPDRMLAASIGTGIWQSTDNGLTWQSLGLTGLHPTDLVFDSHDPTRLWLCAPQSKYRYEKYDSQLAGFYRSLDAGKTWQKLSTTSPVELVQDRSQSDHLVAIFDRNMIRHSTDAGHNWQDFIEGLAINPQQSGAISPYGYRALTAGHGFFLAGSSNGVIYRREYDASNWKIVRREGLDVTTQKGLRRAREIWGWSMNNLMIDPRDPDHWFETDFYGVSQTHDAGRNWTVTVHGIECTVIHALVQDPSDPQTIHMGMADNGYLRSDNGGLHFTRHNFPDMAITCKDIVLHSQYPKRLFAIGPKKWTQHIAQVFISENRGQTWERTAMQGLPDLNKAMCTSIAMDADDPDRLYLAVSGDVGLGTGGPYVSSDRGKTWRWIGSGLPNTKPMFWHMPWGQGRELAAGHDGTLIAISRKADSTGVYRFDANSQTWQRAALSITGQPGSVVADLLTPGRFFVAVQHQGIARSIDDGRTWQWINHDSAMHIIVDRVVPDRVACSTDNGVLLSVDGGEHWQMLDQALPDRVVGNMPAFAGDRLLVGSDGSGAFWMPLDVVKTQK